MFTLFGIVLLVAGAILTFAVDRQADGVDLQLVGWILMAGGGLSLCIGMIRAASAASATLRHAPAGVGRDVTSRAASRAVPNDVDRPQVVRPEQERHAA